MTQRIWFGTYALLSISKFSDSPRFCICRLLPLCSFIEQTFYGVGVEFGILIWPHFG